MSRIYSKYLSDPEVGLLTGDEAFINKMLRVESALAEVQVKQGVIPEAAGKAIALTLRDFEPSPEALTAGTLQNGVPILPLLELIRNELPAEARDYVHWGVTSQDIMDTATVLMIREVVNVFELRLVQLIESLEKLARKHEKTYLAARTRTQQAVPMSFALKVISWIQPLARHLQRLGQLKPRLLVVQLGGAGGNLAALGDQAWETAQELAKELELGFAGVWHSQRDNMAEFSAWLALTAGSLGKMAQDILLLSQTEIGEVKESGDAGGQSSTMPHKSNPVLSEAIVALTRYVAQLSGGAFHAMIHTQERDGTAWAVEWLTLPEMMIACGTAIRHALTISQTIRIDKTALQANLDRSKGLIFSEQASFLLCHYLHLPRPEAKKVVQQACKMVLQQNMHLAVALEQLLPDLPIDWGKALQPENYRGFTKQILDLSLGKARRS